MEFLDKHRILYINFNQAFEKVILQTFVILFLAGKISIGFDSGLLTGMFKINLQNASDNIDHNILIQKMLLFGFTNEVIHCFRSCSSSIKFLGHSYPV